MVYCDQDDVFGVQTGLSRSESADKQQTVVQNNGDNC